MALKRSFWILVFYTLVHIQRPYVCLVCLLCQVHPIISSKAVAQKVAEAGKRQRFHLISRDSACGTSATHVTRFQLSRGCWKSLRYFVVPKWMFTYKQSEKTITGPDQNIQLNNEQHLKKDHQKVQIQETSVIHSINVSTSQLSSSSGIAMTLTRPAHDRQLRVVKTYQVPALNPEVPAFVVTNRRSPFLFLKTCLAIFVEGSRDTASKTMLRFHHTTNRQVCLYSTKPLHLTPQV